MNSEEFKVITAQLTKGSKVRVRLIEPQLTCPMDFTGKIYDRGPLWIEVGIKGVRGLRRLLFTQVDLLEILPSNSGIKT